MPPDEAENRSDPGALTRPQPDNDDVNFDIIELLFFAYRDFISDPDAILSKSKFGRAHHRVVHFVNRRPGLTVADLLETLKITKQSLARVLKQLIDSGYIHQVAGHDDRRQRRLYPTQKGRELAMELARPQSRRIAKALRDIDPGGQAAIRQFLKGMVDPQ
ncbi:MAG: MarR family transcriptional regulator [Alphaproteobacteria bacterium]|nr:MarR family transcriptional regulator [Alphaproteobacteria bacterium]